MITPEQIRAARGLLRLDQATLARDVGISVITLRRLEDRHGLSKVAPATVEAVRRSLEKAGAEFVERGVRQRAGSAETLRAIKDDIDAIVVGAAAQMAAHPTLSDDELCDENGV